MSWWWLFTEQKITPKSLGILIWRSIVYSQKRTLTSPNFWRFVPSNNWSGKLRQLSQTPFLHYRDRLGKWQVWGLHIRNHYPNLHIVLTGRRSLSIMVTYNFACELGSETHLETDRCNAAANLVLFGLMSFLKNFFPLQMSYHEHASRLPSDTNEPIEVVSQ